MGSWKDLFLDMLRLTEEVKRLNRSVERLDAFTIKISERVVRLETMVEIAERRPPNTEPKKIETE